MSFCEPTIAFWRILSRRLSCGCVRVMLRFYFRSRERSRACFRVAAPLPISIPLQSHSKSRRHRRYHPPQSALRTPQRSPHLVIRRLTPGPLERVHPKRIDTLFCWRAVRGAHSGGSIQLHRQGHRRCSADRHSAAANHHCSGPDRSDPSADHDHQPTSERPSERGVFHNACRDRWLNTLHLERQRRCTTKWIQEQQLVYIVPISYLISAMNCAIGNPPNGFPQGNEEHISLRVWPPVCASRLLLRHLNQVRLGRGERCGTRTIGTSSSLSQAAPGNGTARRARSVRAAPSVCSQPWASASPNWAMPGSTWKPRSSSACLWTPRALDRSAPTFWRCATLYAWSGSRTEG
jgi:hypothetical protein